MGGNGSGYGEPTMEDREIVQNSYMKKISAPGQSIPRQMLLDSLTDTGWSDGKANNTIEWMQNDGVIIETGSGKILFDTYYEDVF